MLKNNIKFSHNYHTHTIYCFHATNTVQEIIIDAIKNGFKTIGFSEHAPLKIHRKFRLNLNNVNEYVEEVNFYKRKYKKQINVLCGFEAEYHQSQYNFYKKLRDIEGVDYMIFGNHNMGDPNDCKEWNINRIDLKKYQQQFYDAAASGLFSCIAHPDIVYRYYLKWDQAAIDLAKFMIDTSIKFDIPLGFNLNGLRMKLIDLDYPVDAFWKMVSESNAKFMIEADAHEIYTLGPEMVEKGIQLIKKWKLEKNLIDKLVLK